MRALLVGIAAVGLAASLFAAGGPPPVAVVFCAPGYPGSTAEAQPNMDAFAGAVSKAAGWSAGSLSAVYHETEKAGLERLERGDAALAIVPLPFYLEHAAHLGLKPLLQAVPKDAEPGEVWSLVGKKGRVASAAQLSGFEIHSLGAYSSRFVRATALGAWGRVPEDARLVFTGQVLSALRRAAKGDDVAVLLDGAQSASLASLPFAADLEVVARSPKVPSALLCAVKNRLPEKRLRSVLSAMQRLHEGPEGAAALDGLRLARFTKLDAPGLDAARRAFEGSAK